MGFNEMIYFNNAADSFPKLGCVNDFLSNQDYYITGRECSCQTDKMKMITEIFRSNLKEFLHIPDNYLVTITSGATAAANLVIQSFWKNHTDGQYVVFDHGCHNSVIRPIYELYGEKNCEMHRNCFFSPDSFDIDSMNDCCSRSKELCQFIVFSYQSNVTGSVLTNVHDIIDYVVDNNMNNCNIILDITQAIGNTDIDVTNILNKHPTFDRLYLFGTTHKSLGSISGCGFLIHPTNNNLHPLMYGGTGTGDHRQPREFPHYLECGTYNITAIACANKAIDYATTFLKDSQNAKRELVNYFISKWNEMSTETVSKFVTLQSKFVNPESGIINLIPANDSVGESLAVSLFDKHYVTRFGCHCCSKFIYKENGRDVHQTLRISFNSQNTKSEIDQFIYDISMTIIEFSGILNHD